MLEIFSNIALQVAILFILIATGFTLGKFKLVNSSGAKSITDILLYLVTPCVIIKSFWERSFSKDTLKMLILSFLLAMVANLIFIGISSIFIRDKDKRNERVLRFGAVFSNCGFMSLPLQQALIGSDGVFFGASFVAIFNVFVWTYGVSLMSGDKKNLLSKKAILNPGVIAVLIGTILFVCSVPAPKIIFTPIASVAALNTPLPMMLIGFYLSGSSFTKFLKNGKFWLTSAMRLIILPIITLGLFWLCGVRGTMLISLSISVSAPTAANTTMFSEKFENNTPLSASLVSFSTLLSLLTMPVIVTFATLIS